MFNFRPLFADTAAILAAGETWHAGGDVYAPLATDPFGRPHVYGPAWLLTGAIGLKASDALWVGAVLAAVFTVAVTLTLWPRRGTEVLLVAPLLCSPPILLGVTRGNNDVVIFVMLAAAAWLLSRSRRLSAVTGRILIGLAAVLKLYPFAVLPALLLREPQAPKRSAEASSRTFRLAPLLWFGGTALVCIGVVWIWADDYRRATQLAPNPVSIVAYGFSVTSQTWHAMRQLRPAFAAGAGAALILGAVLFGRRMRRLWTLAAEDGFASLALVFGALSWIFSYLVIRSFPYRLLLVLLPARLWLQRTRDNEHAAVARIQLVLWIVVAWLDVPKRAVVGHSEQTNSFSPETWNAVAAMIGFEQILVLLLTVCLAITTAGAFVHNWKQPGD